MLLKYMWDYVSFFFILLFILDLFQEIVYKSCEYCSLHTVKLCFIFLYTTFYFRYICFKKLYIHLLNLIFEKNLKSKAPYLDFLVHHSLTQSLTPSLVTSETVFYQTLFRFPRKKLILNICDCFDTTFILTDASQSLSTV